jgi:hypothetical protein
VTYGLCGRRWIARTTLSLLFSATATAQDPVQWISRHDGPAHGWDQAMCLALDEQGFAHVGGWVTATRPPSRYEWSDKDFAVLKVSPSGEIVWARQLGNSRAYFEFAQDIVVDVDGSVFATGNLGDSSGYLEYLATVKYSADGELLWMARFGEERIQWGQGQAIVLDGEGGVVVTGYAVGNPSGSTSLDLVTIRYDHAGEAVWTSVYDGPLHSEDRAMGLARDRDGNVLVTGRVAAVPGYDGGKDCDLATIKYDAEGRLQWVRRHNGLQSATDVGRCVEVGDSGNVYVTGSTQTGIQSWYGDDAITLAYSPEGALLWSATYEGPGSSWDVMLQLELDESENVYVAGASISASGYPDSDYVVIKYGNDGQHLWTTRYAGGPPYGASDGARALALGPDGSVYVTGSTYVPYAGTTLRLDALHGDVTWTHHLALPLIGKFSAFDMAVGRDGDLWLAGVADTPATANSELATVRIRPDGTSTSSGRER